MYSQREFEKKLVKVVRGGSKERKKSVIILKNDK